MKTHLRTLLFAAAVGLLAAGCENRSSSSSLTTKESPKEEKVKGAVVKRVEAREPAVPTVEEQPTRNTAEEQPSNAQATRVEMEEEKEDPPEADPPIPEKWKPLNKAKTIYMETAADGKRRVHVLTEVCLREGPLEVLLCRKGTKEHEAILSADIDAREVHAALMVAGAKPGTTVRYSPSYKPATGDTVKVSVTYNKDGKLTTRPAQEWVQHMRTKKPMEHEWVFAGSRLFQDPDRPDAPPFYCANNGEVISIANFTDSMLDLPVQSSKEEAELGFAAKTDRIPPLKTKVIVTLEPAEKK